jgi:hypothetical protein
MRLRKLQPFVFCAEYRERNQRRSNGEFELSFQTEDGKRFHYANSAYFFGPARPKSNDP